VLTLAVATRACNDVPSRNLLALRAVVLVVVHLGIGGLARVVSGDFHHEERLVFVGIAS